MSKSIPPTCLVPDTGPKYWRSLDQLEDTPAFRNWVEREFPAGASEFADEPSRRHFMKIMSASFMLAGLGLTGCRRPEEHILPFGKLPENYIHGVPQFYATAMPVRGGAIPLVAKSNDGRPTKVEGNAQHPDSNGGTDQFAQASILNLYDPDRAMRFVSGGQTASREAALDALGSLSKQLATSGGDKVAILLDRSSSPSRARLQKEVGTRLPKARWFAHEPVDFDVHREAASLAYGGSVRPYLKLDAAKCIVSLDCDFIGGEEDNHRLIRGFAKSRKLASANDADKMSRLYVVEALMTLTGAQADHRLRMPSSQVLAVAAKLAAAVLAAKNTPAALALNGALSALGAGAKVDEKWITACAKDLVAHADKSVVVAGYNQPLAVHLIADAINFALGSVGSVVELRPVVEPAAGGIAELAKALNDGQVETLIIVNDNPAYGAAADLDWAKTQRKSKTVVRLGYYEDETAQVCDWHFPAAHYLESWGDARTSDGTLVAIQPLIAPLFGGITELEFLARLGGLSVTNPHDIVRETFRGLAPTGNFEESWKQFLHDGFLANSASKAVGANFNWAKAAEVVAAAKPLAASSKDSLEVVFHRDSKVDDGRYNNNGWLMELPEPVTKLVWENVILLSQKTADDLGLVIKDHEDNDLQVPLVKVTLNGREVTGPAWVQPGMADNVLGLALGYGREKVGRVGQGTGFNAYRIRTSTAPYIAAGAKLADTGVKHPLSTTQNHWVMEGRPVIREANVEQYRKQPKFATAMNMHEPPGNEDEHGHPLPLYPNPLDVPDKNGVRPRDKSPHAWGMSIDLNACVGCSACVIACQSENNIPIVGKDQVSRNREMHWLRLDRYYTGSVTDPQMIQQPMLCQHCESAPCESVCPVNATVHDEEGLNVMAYNRCVGTRYCSNNCPYKVRRFNYLDFNKRPLELLKGPFYSTPLLHSTDGEWDLARWWRDPSKGIRPEQEWELLKLAKNPDVTVRMRGVMEKCTFCVQRIEQAKIGQKVKAGASGDIAVADGTLKTACQQACPAEAIVFGNVKDEQSAVSKLKAQDRDYTVLEFLNNKPRTTYLARVRNPNPELSQEAPFSLQEWQARGNTLEPHHAAPAKPGETHAPAAPGAKSGGTH